MGRTRTKSKKTFPKITESPAEKSTSEPSVLSLLEKAQTLIAQCDYGLARLFVQRILEQSPTNAEAREMLGVVQLETGEIDGAKTVSTRPRTSEKWPVF
jgi:Flp pilus assembly protein TadD